MKKIRKTYCAPKIKVGEIEIEAIFQDVSNIPPEHDDSYNDDLDEGDPNKF